MTTIKKRAYKKALKLFNPQTRITTQELLIEFATEQRKIDIDNACEWINANWRKYIDTDADGMICFSGWKNDLKQAMEE